MLFKECTFELHTTPRMKLQLEHLKFLSKLKQKYFCIKGKDNKNTFRKSTDLRYVQSLTQYSGEFGYLLPGEVHGVFTRDATNFIQKSIEKMLIDK